MSSYNLREYRQWILWDYEDGTKIPKKLTGQNARSNDPASWYSFEELAGHSQVAFVFSSDDPFFGIDLDDCIEAGKLNAQAEEIVSAFRGKALIEISPSKTGIKITAAGKKPEGSRCVYWLGLQKIEIYDRVRFWTITDDLLFAGDSGEIQDCQQELDSLLGKLTSENKAKPVQAPIYTKITIEAQNELEQRARRYLESIPLPTKGTINDTLFSVCGHLHSFRTADHAALSPQQIFSLAWGWCHGCDPGLTEDYLWDRIETSARCGKARELKYPDERYTAIDQAELVKIDLSGEEDEEELVEQWVPKSGLIREIYDYYMQVAVFPSPIMGMGTAMSLVEMLFGQRLQTETGLRTNDLNVVLGPTGCGKEACEKTISKILMEAGYDNYIMPAGVQSGNGLLGFLAENPVCIWVKDEFGVYLEGVFGKRKQPMEAQVGRFLLELYNKADTRYSGNAHAAGAKHIIEQPHLVLLGLSTYGTIFEHLSFKDVESGLLNRMAFWCVTQSPPWKDDVTTVEPSEAMISRIRRWIEFQPKNAKGKPQPITLMMTPEARQRWCAHRKAIYERKDREDTGRASMWSRTAARTLKFALCAAASRQVGPEAISEFQKPQIEISDVDWAIRLSNWVTRSACDLISANTTNTTRSKAEIAILDFVKNTPDWVSLRVIQRTRRIVRGDLIAAAQRLAAEKAIQYDSKPYGSREKHQVKRC